MDLAFTEIATTARAALQVARRRLAADDDLDAAVPSLDQASGRPGRHPQLTGEGVRSVASAGQHRRG